MKNQKCDICGREIVKGLKINKVRYCPKHYKQMKKYGKVLDSNPRTIYDKNEINIVGDIAYISIYDKLQNKICEAIVDAEDVDKIKNYKWRLNGGGYVINTPRNKKTNFLHRIITGTNDENVFIDHINHNVLDNRKENLRQVNKSENMMNNKFAKGVYYTKKGKPFARIKINQKTIHLGVFEEVDEAFYARWYAEQLLFKEFAYKEKIEPEISERRKKEIKEMIEEKIDKVIK